MDEDEMRAAVSARIEPWLKAYMEWPQPMKPGYARIKLFLIEAFHAGWDAAMAAATEQAGE